MDGKTKKITLSAMAFLGILCIASGVIMPLVIKGKDPENIIKFKITQKKVAKTKTNEIKLKDMESEINTPISVDIKDYLVYELDNKILKQLKLDTSAINVTQAGNYTYTITYKKKTYNGTYIIKEKPLPAIEKMTLKSLKLTKGATLSTDITTYIVETIPEEAKIAIKLDLSGINVNIAGTYQYTITYNGKFYTGNIEIYEPQVTLPTPPKKEEEDTSVTTPITPTPEEDNTKTE